MGLNTEIGRGINEGTTDHFVVVTGRGYDYDLGLYYYIYMETGVSELSEGCDATQNRLYWDPVSNEFYDPSNYNGERVDVTQVRPNDGRTWSGTIAVWEVNK